MMTQVTPDHERVTAVMTSHMSSGENFDGAILIGIYPSSPGEVWVEMQGRRTNIQVSDVDAFCKQLKRAAKLAAAQEPQQ